MNELGDGHFKLEGMSADEVVSVERTRWTGKSAGQVIICVHVTLALS